MPAFQINYKNKMRTEKRKAAKKTRGEEIIFLVEEALERGFEAQALGFSIFTEAESIPELKQAIRDAVECHFPAKQRPQIIRLHFVRDEVMAI